MKSFFDSFFSLVKPTLCNSWNSVEDYMEMTNRGVGPGGQGGNYPSPAIFISRGSICLCPPNIG